MGHLSDIPVALLVDKTTPPDAVHRRHSTAPAVSIPPGCLDRMAEEKYLHESAYSTYLQQLHVHVVDRPDPGSRHWTCRRRQFLLHALYSLMLNELTAAQCLSLDTASLQVNFRASQMIGRRH